MNGLLAGISRRFVLAGIVGAALVGATAPAAAQGKVTLSFAVSGADRGPLRDVSMHIANRMKELTNSRVTVDRFMGGTLGGEVQLGELLASGEIDIILTGVFADSFFPEYTIGSIPFLLPTWEDKAKFFDHPTIRQKITEKLKPRGLVYLEPITMGAQYITSNRSLIEPADIKGMKLRVAEDKAQIEIYGGVGALVTPISAKEIVSALKTGIVDGQVNTLANNFGRQLWETQKFLIRGNHIVWPWNLATSEKALAKLTPEDRQVLVKVAREARELAVKSVEQHEQPMIETMTKQRGMTLVEWSPDQLKRWQVAASPAIAGLLKDRDPLLIEIVKSLGGM